MNGIYSLSDSVSERLRSWSRKPMGSARAGSNPVAVAFFFRLPRNLVYRSELRASGVDQAAPLVVSNDCLHRLAVRTSRCGRDNPGSNPGVDIFVLSV